MTRRRVEETELAPLRERAQSSVFRKVDPEATAEPSQLELLTHELQAHEVELRTQNEELLASRNALEESRDRYQELYDSAPIGYLTLDREARVVEANLAAAGLLGVERNRLVGCSLYAYFSRAQADALRRHLSDVFETGVKLSCDLTLTGDTGQRETSLHIDSVSFADAKGDRAQCRSVLIDLSEVRRAQADHRAWQARGTALLDTVADAIVSSDATGQIVAFNHAAEQLFGYREEETIGRNVRMLMPATYREDHNGYLARYMATGTARIIGQRSREVLAQRKDGTTVPVELRIGEWWEHGERRFTAILHDISERKRAEQALVESEQRFQLMADSAPLLLWMSDAAGKCTFFNRGWLDFTGRTLGQERGEGWLRGLDPDDAERCALAFRNAVSGQRSFQLEVRLRRASGHYGWVLLSGQPRFDKGGTFAGHVGAAMDVSAFKDLQEDLRQAQKMEAVGALATGVAHDFGNVLQAVLGCVNLARDEETPRQSAIEYLDRAAAAARRGGKLVGQLLAFAHKQPVELAPIEVDALIRGSARLIERLLTEQVALKVRLGARGAMILADAVQIEQILLNVAANARDAMPDGGTLEVRTDVVDADSLDAQHLGLSPAQRYVRLAIRDDGPGMDATTRRRAFEPFFTTREVGKGTGLGLSTVFAVTKQLGGRVSLDSDPGKGTAFTFCFPLCRQLTESTRPKSAPALRFHGSALLVEDDPVVRMTVRHYLEELGFDVSEAADPLQAEREFALRPADLLVSDVVLPTMRGTKLAARLRERHADLRVLLMSASSQFQLEGAAADDEYQVLPKPFGKGDLCERLALLLPHTRVDHVSLPPPGPVPREASIARPPSARRGQRTILIVEDEPTALAALRDVLELEGYRAIAADTSRQALALAAHEPRIDLVISDVRLPEMTGDVLAARLRELHPQMRLVFMSALPEAPLPEVAFVQKPVDLDALVALLDQTLSTHSST